MTTKEKIQAELENLSKEQLMSQFNMWKKQLVTNPNIMGGETVFPNSRLSVRHVGAMLERGETKENILEDYPYLSEVDLKFASLYLQVYPKTGRTK